MSDLPSTNKLFLIIAGTVYAHCGEWDGSYPDDDIIMIWTEWQPRKDSEYERDNIVEYAIKQCNIINKSRALL
ncbi:hypothetical protein [Solitalea lacus]|uniref:hypothetical protein n=1 Tax=Solitalea lacus TaxID=2911172 RepID=UPI001EDB191E|nr:hypothetical protein [Solitalea lacus]UKJ08080.1 hypothetical protein L2B55_02675 [Solitalea lacus]